MAISFSLSPFKPSLLLPSISKPSFPKPSSLHLTQTLQTPTRLRAIQSENPNPTNPDDQISSPEPEPETSSSAVAEELKQMMKEKREREKEDEGLFSGVGEEVREIEWPELGKVVGTTGVVLAVIAGSTAVLLSVNALLAEVSDKVFAGKGIQDFF